MVSLHELPASRGTGWPFDEQTPRPDVTVIWPRISIVVPSYEQADFLEETLRSILLQSYPDLELLVVDGGSKDGTTEVLERYAPWISWWVSESDGGQSDAINKGFRRATGEILTFIGSDDVYEPGAFQEVGRLYRSSPECGVVAGAFRFLDVDSLGGAQRGEPIPARYPGEQARDLTLEHPSTWRIHQVSTFYSRSALDEVGRKVVADLHYTMDRELLYRVARVRPVILTHRCLAAFRRHARSKSVASILPMSREMGDLHLRSARAGESPEVLRLRRRLARHHWARGYWKLARSGIGPLRGVGALLRVLRFRPGWAFRRGYLAAWAEVLGLGSSRDKRRSPSLDGHST